MTKIFISLLLWLFLLHLPVFAENTGDAVSSADSQKPSTDIQNEKADVPQAKESVPALPVQPPEPPPAPVPPGIPPGVSFTPEQIKKFLAKPKEENFIILNFDNAALKDVINTISSITKENFILSPGLDARITINSAGKIPSSEVLSVFESILEVNNMALVKSGQFFKIIPGATAKQKPLDVQKGRDAEAVPSGDRPVTYIIPVEYVPVGELTPLFQPLLSQFGSLVPNPRNNLLIINELASNVSRILSVLKEIDIDAFQNSRMGFFQPEYSDVRTIADELTGIVNALNLARDGTVAIVPIERINSLVVFCSSPQLLRTVEEWFKKLDSEVAIGQNIFVYPVQNVKAESVANILKTIYKAEDAAAKQHVAGRPVQQTTRARVPTTQALTALESGRVEIVTFEPTNSLVILAPPGLYKEITETIKKLDAYPKEVLIEVIIAEVTLTDSDQLGVQWSLLHDVHIEGGDFSGLAQGRASSAPSYTIPLTLGTGSASASLTAGGFSYLLFKPERLVAMIHAISSRGKVNILSSPRLLVRNQEEASIEVGSDIPTATSSTTSAAATVTTSTLTQNIEYKTVGIKLKIKPSINDEKTVVLDIEQEVSDQLSNVTVGQEGFSYPSFSTRKAKTSIIVPDRQGIVIGGIMKEKKNKNYQGVPLLSAIPILGNLFRYTVDTREKTELIVLLTPHVITNKKESEALSTEFIDKLRNVKEFLQKEDRQISVSPPAEANQP